MEAAYFSEIMETAYNITRYHKSVEHTLKSHCLETNKSRSVKAVTVVFCCTFSAPNFIIVLIFIIHISLLVPSFRVRFVILYAAAALRKHISTSLLSFSFDPLLTTNICLI